MRTVTEHARAHRVEVIVRETDAVRAAAVSEADFVARVGAVRLVMARPVPELGVNHGHLGFLVEIAPERLPDALDASSPDPREFRRERDPWRSERKCALSGELARWNGELAWLAGWRWVRDGPTVTCEGRAGKGNRAWRSISPTGRSG